MAIMSDPDRQACAAEYMANPEVGEITTILKGDIQAGVNALDQWFSDNAAVLNQALPPAARSGLSQEQKARLLTTVVYWRYLKQPA